MSTLIPPATSDTGERRLHRPLSGEQRTNQQVDPEWVTVSGREYLVFPTVAAREMVLDYPEYGTRELLPKEHLDESVPLWSGTPLVFVHPENERRTADDPREYTQTVIGQAYEPQMVDDKLRVMSYVDVEKARDLGGLAETVVEKLAAGEALGVSAGYATIDDDRDGGTHNGTAYDIEQGHIVPDHIAIFPNDEFTARCDWEDGCGAPRVNTVITNALDEARTPTYDSLTSAEWEPPSFTDYITEWYDRNDRDPPDTIQYDTVAERAKEWTARRTLIGDPDAESAAEIVSFPVVDLDDQLNENALTAARNLAFNAEAEESLLAETASLLETAPENNGEWPSGTTYSFNRDNMSGQRPFPDESTDRFEDEADALRRAYDIGCSEVHQNEAGEYIPCESDVKYETLLSRQNRLSACTVCDEFDLERETAEAVRTAVNAFAVSNDMDGFRDRVANTEVTDAFDPDAVYAALAAVPRTNIQEGEYVQWDWVDGTAFGQVAEIVDEGSRTVEGNTREVDGESDRQIAVIEQLTQDEGSEVGQRVLKYIEPGDSDNENNLRRWDAPPAVRNTDTDATTVTEPDRSNMDLPSFQPPDAQTDRLGIYIPTTEPVDADAIPPMVEKAQSMMGEPLAVDAKPVDGGVFVEPSDRAESAAEMPHMVVDMLESAAAEMFGLSAKSVLYAQGPTYGDVSPCFVLSEPVEPDVLNQIADLARFIVGEMVSVWQTENRLYLAYGPELGHIGLDTTEIVVRRVLSQQRVSVQSHAVKMLAVPDEAIQRNAARTNIPGATEDYTLTRTGEYVTWDAGNGERRHGQVVDVADEGCLSVGGRERCAGEQSRVVRVQRYETDGTVLDDEVLKLVRREGPNENNLRSWNAPRSARMNSVVRINEVTAEVGDRTVDLTPPPAVVTAAETALAKKDELGKGDCGTGVGERRAQQIVNENLGPADFLGRSNGTPIPTYLASHSEDVQGIDQPPSQWSDEIWDGVVTAGDSPRCGPVQYALWGGTATGTGREWANSVAAELEDAMEAAENSNTIQVNVDATRMSEHQPDETDDPASLFSRFLSSLGIESDGEGAEELMSTDREHSDDDGRDVDTAGDMHNASGTVSDDGDTSDQMEDAMTDDTTESKTNQLETMEPAEVAAKTAFGITELNEMDDQMLSAIEQTVIELSKEDDEGGDGEMAEMVEAEAGGSETEMGGDGEMYNAEGDDAEPPEQEPTENVLTADEAAEQFASADEVESVAETLSELKDMVENIDESENEAEREQQARQVANAIDGMSVEAAKQLPDDELADMAERHGQRVNYAGVPGSVNRDVQANGTSEDVDEYPAGGRSNWAERSGGD